MVRNDPMSFIWPPDNQKDVYFYELTLISFNCTISTPLPDKKQVFLFLFTHLSMLVSLFFKQPISWDIFHERISSFLSIYME